MNTSSQVRLELMETLKSLKQGKTEVKVANAVTKAASAINQSVRFDIENKRENIKLMKATAKKTYRDLAPTALTL